MTLKDKILHKKSVDEIINESSQNKLNRSLSAIDLMFLGIGCVIGSGIFTISGVAIAGDAMAGPSFILSLLLAGIACVFSALAYAEFSSMVPISGSAYAYTYTTFGELPAWMIGWVLMIEYIIGATAVSVAWSAYWFSFLKGFDFLPDIIKNPQYWIYEFHPAANFTVHLNIPSIFAICVLTSLLYLGIKESKKVNNIMIFIKLAVIFLFVTVGCFYVKPQNWTPFFTGGLSGMFQGAFLIFFAYVGFDAISTVAEETKNPQKDLPIGIIGALISCTVIYILMGAVITGMVSTQSVIGNHDFIYAPVPFVMRFVGQNWFAGLIAIATLAGLSSVLLVMMLASSRILFAMSRDDLLPKVFSKIHPKFKTPHIVTIFVGMFLIASSFVLNLEEAAHLCNIGTFTAFIVVSVAVIVLRYTQPDRPRPFKIPFMPYTSVVGILISLFIVFKGIPLKTLCFFSIWLSAGVIIYFLRNIKFFLKKSSD